MVKGEEFAGENVLVEPDINTHYSFTSSCNEVAQEPPELAD